MVRVKDILAWVDARAPLRFAETWDACGLQVGDPDGRVERLLVALDPSTATLLEAERKRCQCLLTHHPLIFRPLPAVRSDQYPGRLVITALQKGIHLLAAHTNLDVAREGTNDQLARLLSLQSLEPLEVAAHLLAETSYSGLGRLGSLPRSLSLRDFVASVRHVMGDVPIRVVGEMDKMVHRVALCTGSGGSLMERVLATDADVFVTGDVKYHEAQRAVEGGLAVVDLGHFASERIIVEPLAEFLRDEAARREMPLVVLTAEEEKDPFESV